ncbi:hypothetical protein L1887_59180 [Cichorium endivia]|nr:hypothetical protein L1887_59180 [Cichorium endivia]
MLGGGLWGSIPGYLRAKRGINEVIVTLLMNYVAINIVSYFAGGPMMQEGAPYPYSAEISEDLWLPLLLSDTDTHIGVLIAALLSLMTFVVFKYTTIGFSMTAVGKSPQAARYAGMSVNRNLIGSMIAGGAIAGLAGGDRSLSTGAQYIATRHRPRCDSDRSIARADRDLCRRRADLEIKPAKAE